MSADRSVLLELAELAVDAVLPALTAPGVRDRLETDTKSSATDMVTAMDRWVEQTIVELILAERPGDGLVGEEGAAKESKSGVVWVIDPIDGTTNFIRNLPGFSVSIAARIHGTDAVAVVHDPVRTERFTAVLAGGAQCNGESISAANASEISRAVVSTGFSYDPQRRAEQAAVLERLLPSIADIRRFGGAALDVCSVASGRVDAYFERGVNDWDVAAGGLIAREAGAVTNNQLDSGGPYVAAAPALAEEFANLLATTSSRSV